MLTRSRVNYGKPRSALAGAVVMVLAAAVGLGQQIADADANETATEAPLVILDRAVGRSSTGDDSAPLAAQAGWGEMDGLQGAVRLRQGGRPLRDDAPGGCTVSALLVPSCGAWFGAATTDRARTYNYRVGLAEYEAVAQNEPDIQHFYSANGKPIPTRTQRELAHRPGHQRSLLLINWKPSKNHTWRQVANGAADHYIESAATGMRSYPHKFFLTIWHEPENDFGPGRQPADYVAMYRYVVEKLRSLGVDNVVYVWNMMGYSGHGHLYDGLYPGHDVVDWIAWDPYSRKGTTMAELVNENCCRARNWTGFYDWAVRTAPGKPLMLAEWGFDLSVNPAGPSALDGALPTLRTDFPELKALVAWNENGIGTYRIDTPTARGRAYGEAYRRLAGDPYFNSTSTAAAP